MTRRQQLRRLFVIRRRAARLGDRLAWLNVSGQIRLALRRGWRHG